MINGNEEFVTIELMFNSFRQNMGKILDRTCFIIRKKVIVKGIEFVFKGGFLNQVRIHYLCIIFSIK